MVARTAGASGGNRNDGSAISSACAAMSEATAGTPAAIASITGSENPSASEGTTTHRADP